MKKLILLVFASMAIGMGQLSAQASASPRPPSAPPEVGALAPDFSLPGSTRYGTLKTPVKLSDYRGKTVVLAFFPAARTRGCTVQMRAYRDQYQELFKSGRNVVVIGISADPVETQHIWATEEDFPMIFASDAGLGVAALYGTNGGSRANRNLFVVDPSGRIAYRALPFNEVDPQAYEALGKQIEILLPAGGL